MRERNLRDLLRDERRYEFQVVFRARVNRSLMRKYERRQQERREARRSTKRVGLYADEGGQAGVPETVSPERSRQSSARSPELNAGLQKPS